MFQQFTVTFWVSGLMFTFKSHVPLSIPCASFVFLSFFPFKFQSILLIRHSVPSLVHLVCHLLLPHFVAASVHSLSRPRFSVLSQKSNKKNVSLSASSSATGSRTPFSCTNSLLETLPPSPAWHFTLLALLALQKALMTQRFHLSDKYHWNFFYLNILASLQAL